MEAEVTHGLGPLLGSTRARCDMLCWCKSLSGSRAHHETADHNSHYQRRFRARADRAQQSQGRLRTAKLHVGARRAVRANRPDI